MSDIYWPSSREHCSACPFKALEPSQQNVTALYEKQLVHIFGEALLSDDDSEPNFSALSEPQRNRHVAARRCAQMIADKLCTRNTSTTPPSDTRFIRRVK